MNKRTLQKIISVVLALGLFLTSVYVPASDTYAETVSEWESLAGIDDAALSGKSVAVTMTTGEGKVYALPAAAAASSSPAAVLASAGGKLTIDGKESDFGWKITKTSDGTYNFVNSEGKYLYLTDANAGVCVGDKPKTGADFSLTDGYLTADTGSTRYVGVYAEKSDWRCYAGININISNQTLGFWAYSKESRSDEETPEAETPEEEKTVSTVKEALDGAENKEFSVKGVVTLVDGKNLYIQDENGGIDLYCASAPSGIGLGDTVTGKGSRSTYNGLPQLSKAEVAKVTGSGETLPLEARETRIGALTDADICTYVSLKDLEVTEVFDNNGSYSTPNITLKDKDGASIQLYKAVVGKTDGAWDVKAGDTVDVRAALSIYKGYQLRNTEASEITVTASSASEETKKFTVSAADTENGSVSLSAAEVPEGDEVTVTLTPEKGYETDKVLVNGAEKEVSGNEFTLAVTEDTVITVTFRLSAPDEPVNETWTRLTKAPADGAKVVIYYPADGFVLTSAASGNKLAGTAGTVSDGRLTITEDMAQLDVSLSDGLYTFKNADGGYLTSGETGNSLSFADTESEYSGWKLEQQTDGSWYLVNAKAAYKGSVQALEYYRGFTTYGVKADNALYKFEFYGPGKEEEEGPVTDLSQLKDGSSVVIYNPGNELAMSSNVLGSDWYLAGDTVTIKDNKAIDPADNLIWDVSVKDGVYTFSQGSRALTAWLSGTYVELTSNASAEGGDTGWTITESSEGSGLYYMASNTLATTYGKAYIEVMNKKVSGASQTVFGGYSCPESKLSEKAFGMQFYQVDSSEEGPQDKGDLVTDLSQLKSGTTVSIYSPGHKTAISTKPNGDWYLKADKATVENGKVTNFTQDFVWTVRENADGTYSFYAYGDETRSMTVWPSGNYAELSLNVDKYPDNTWTLTSAKTEDCWYFSSPTVSGDNGPAYVEAYVRNEAEVFSGYFTKSNSGRFSESDFALQFYLVDPDDAIGAYDDGEWDGVLKEGEQYVIYNVAAESSLGIYKEANYAFDAVATTLVNEGGTTLADPGNGALIFTVGTMGRYYSFRNNGKYLATNNSEELLFMEAKEDGSVPEEAKWYLTDKGDGYILYNKECSYNGTPVCIEYFSSVFSGWTFSSRNDLNIYLFNFYKVTEDTMVAEDTVQDPSAVFDCEDSKCFEQDFPVNITLDDLCTEITDEVITVTCGDKTFAVDMDTVESSADRKSLTFTLPYTDVDQEGQTQFTIRIDVANGYGISYSSEKTVLLIDEPFFDELRPAPNSQTRDDKRPVVSAFAGNVGENPVFIMTLNGEEVEAVFDPETGILSYEPSEDLSDGRTTADIRVVREDGVEGEKSWNFTVGLSDYQMYFGQLHSHTTYSDGSGSLETALDYVDSLPRSANVQFVAFTDHSNYFDSASAANPADAVNDKSLMTEASRQVWDKYKSTVAGFNASHSDIVAIAGFEMTWSGGPGHINTFDSDGLVSRNNAELNNKTGDAGMKLYYETINKGDSLSQFNHPGNTFGNFTDFSYWDPETDDHIFLVEVGNGEGQIGAGGYYPSYEEYILALDKGWHVAPTNNQDNHKGRWGNANEARDVVLTNSFSESGIYDAIRNRRVYATEDKNLQVGYTVNNEYMGTILSEVPGSLDVAVTLYDPDETDAVSKVELVANGGKTAYTWSDEEEIAGGMLTAQIEPSYTYYFVRVTQKDGDLAVTAPVWTGMTKAVGITSIEPESTPVYTGEEATLVTRLFNNEGADAKVASLVYTVKGSEVIGRDTEGCTIPAGGSIEAKIKCTFSEARVTKVNVTAVMENGDSYTASTEIDVIDRESENTVTPIGDVRAASDPEDTGYRFVIEGTLTSNASGYDKDTAFFDCVYIQDETGGICIFPVSGEYKTGDRVRVVGHTDFYQGEPELQVKSIEVIGEGSVSPVEVTSKQVTSREVEGQLITLKGTVDSYEEANGLIQTIMVKDEAGDLARVFIDGYITTGHEVEGCAVGAEITVTGLASYDDTFNAPEGPFPRIRIRDRADVVCAADETVYEITLDPNGSTVSPETVTTGVNGVITQDLPAPKDKDGFVFGGWYDAAEGGNKVEKGDTISSDTTLYARWYELRARLANKVKVPEKLKGTYPSVKKMDEAMISRLESKTGRNFKDHQLFELLVEYKDGETWKILEADMFPVKGVKVTADLPDGVAASDKPAVIHLFAENCNGYKAGYMEIPNDLTVDGDRMTFTVNGTSPLDLAWGKAGKKSSSGSSSGSGSKVKRSTKTGDSANPALWLLLAAGAAGLGTAAVRKRRGKK